MRPTNPKPAALSPVDKRTALVREQAAAQLRTAIQTGRYPPGLRLIERQLCEALDVSRPTLREALRQLEAEKLVIVHPYRGPVVAGITVEQAREIYEVRALLEPKAMELFIDRASTEDFARLEAAAAAFEEAAANSDLSGLVATTELYYRVLLSGARNECIREIVEGMMARVSYLRGRSMSSRGRLPQSVAEMRAMSDAIRRCDASAARQTCIDHIKSASAAAIRQINLDSSLLVCVPQVPARKGAARQTGKPLPQRKVVVPRQRRQG